MVVVYLSIGTNLGNKYNNIKKALFYLSKFCKIIDSSSIYLTSPLENSNQPEFYNCVVKVNTDLLPTGLLKKLKEIEKRMGRKSNNKRYQPRVIDIDILFYGKKIISKKNLSIPHPKIQYRKFVLYPLVEISKNLIHPLLRQKVSILKKKLKDKSQKIKLAIARLKLRNYIRTLN
ncbi:MAG: 2-amino-4-hydroxy-6-hydroxymethyldihydropteridine diphosphokinase [Endomicrobiia bacterium]